MKRPIRSSAAGRITEREAAKMEAGATCPRCKSDEVRVIRNYGVPYRELWCPACHHRWEPDRTEKEK